MQILPFSELMDGLNKKQLQYFNIYNNDIKADLQQTAKYYLKAQNDTINKDQPISKLFLDIEVFTNNQGFTEDDLQPAELPIYLITLIYTESPIIHTYLLLFDSNIDAFGIKNNMSDEEYSKFVIDQQTWLKNELVNRNYLTNKYLSNVDFNVELNIFSCEKELLISCWNQIHKYDPDLLSSFYGDSFDYPYLYYRICNLFGKENVGSIMSKFGQVSIANDRVQFLEYSVADMLYFYKPRDEGGLQYGKKQPMYSLDMIAEKELGIKKIEYKNKNMTIDEFFIKEPRETTLYNIVDVLLIYGLNNKLNFFDLHNTIRRAMKTNLHNSIIGSSALYEAFVYSKLESENKRIRYALTSESSISFTKEYLNKFGNVKFNNKSLEPIQITANDFSKISKKFPGAYVKNAITKIIDSGIIIDFDASLPPWEKIYIKRDGKVECYKIGEYEFKKGDLTLTVGTDDLITWKEVRGKTRHKWNSKLITFKCEYGHEITVTPNHSLFGMFYCAISNKYDLIDAQFLNVKDFLVTTPIPLNYNNLVLCDIYKNNNFAPQLLFIVDKKVIDYDGYVYDICVDECERFFGGSGILAHNTSMYPSNILQANISFDCYIGRVIPPQCYSTIKLLKKCLGTGQYPNALIGNVQKMVYDYINTNDVVPKQENFLKFYYGLLGLFDILLQTNKTFDEICNPNTSEDSLILKNVLVPLLDIIFTIHPTSQVYNDLVYDYVYNVDLNKPNWQDNRDIMSSKYPDGAFVIMNPMESNIYLMQISINELYELIQKYSIAFSGCMFYKHEQKKGLFVDMLLNFADLRAHHKNLRNSYVEGTFEYNFEDRNQNVFKRLMNTSYGLYGLSSFKYSNHWLARSITNNSMHALKCSMYIGEKYLTEKFGK